MAQSEGICRSASGYGGQCASKLRAGSGNGPIGSVHFPDFPYRRRKVDSVARRIVQPSESSEPGTSNRSTQFRDVRKNSGRHQRNQWFVRRRSAHHSVCAEIHVLNVEFLIKVGGK